MHEILAGSLEAKPLWAPTIPPTPRRAPSWRHFLRFFRMQKKRMIFGMHFFRILADLASPGDPQNRRKSIKIGVRSPLFCKLALFFDFMLIFDDFS